MNRTVLKILSDSSNTIKGRSIKNPKKRLMWVETFNFSWFLPFDLNIFFPCDVSFISTTTINTFSRFVFKTRFIFFVSWSILIWILRTCSVVTDFQHRAMFLANKYQSLKFISVVRSETQANGVKYDARPNFEQQKQRNLLLKQVQVPSFSQKLWSAKMAHRRDCYFQEERIIRRKKVQNYVRMIHSNCKQSVV